MTTPRSSRTTERNGDSDTVKWNDSISAPPIIPFMIGFVFVCIIVLYVIKYLKKAWDKKNRSDRYEITDLIRPQKHPSQLPVLDDESRQDHANLNLLKYSGQKRKGKVQHVFIRDRDDGSEDGDLHHSNGHMKVEVEANVHDSSNENNDFVEELDESPPPAFDQSDHHRMDSNPLQNSTSHAPLAATESEV